MSTLTIPAALRTVRTYQSATPAQTLSFADALVFLNTADPRAYSTRGLVTMAEGLGRSVGRNRIALLMRVRKACPPDVTADGFAAAVKAETDRNRDASAEKAEARKAAAASAEETPASSVPQGDSAPIVTVGQAVAALRLLSERFGNDAAWRDAVTALADAYAPIVLVATPVAA